MARRQNVGRHRELAPHILLKDTDLPHEGIRVDLATHRTQDGRDYYGLNPKGAVPLLELDDGTRLSEGPVICQYICDRAGRTDLMPAAGTPARYRVMEWQNFITSELHKSYSALFNRQLDAAAKAVYVQALDRRHAWVSQQLAERPFLTGETFTAADAYLFFVSGWAALVGVDLSPHTHLQRFLAEVGQRPAVRAARQAEAASA